MSENHKAMRASSYIVYVDLPSNSDEMLLVHGYSGAFDKVSRNVANFVRSLESRPAPKPLYGVWSKDVQPESSFHYPSESTINTLCKRGYLTNMTYEEEEVAYKRFVELLHKAESRKASYIFMPSYDCNLRCAYCFQDHMRTKPAFQHLLRCLTLPMVDRIFKGIPEIESQFGIDPGTQVNRDIGFFGGEPLLRTNRSTVEYIIQKAKEIGTANFWAISNGTELEAFEDLISPSAISRIQITIDGIPQEHNKRRIYSDGSGSFEKIANNINLALRLGVTIQLRMNIDRKNVADLPAFAEIIHERGWNQYPTFGVYTAPIRAANENVTQEEVMDSWELDKSIASLQSQNPLMAVITQPDDGLKRQARNIFAGVSNAPSLKASFCGAHTGMHIFDAFGDIYACWEKTGDSSIRIGFIEEDGRVVMNNPMLQLWRTRTVTSNPVCTKCRYSLYCGGGCGVLADRKTGLLHMNYCDSFGSRFRANVAEAYMDHVTGRPLNQWSDRICDQ